ncbi:fibrinogen-binding protein [Rhizobium tubonense]|uniref:Fibrinogen-binding protein n=1 Tax=Rhizobium tubonense TaxID=484088 RepID=A0A2W4CZY7_9HYPH|nr:fibrinogen-binding protein [Rhizobium tubonense]
MTDDHSKVAALADGFANSAVNSTNIDDGSTGLVGVGNSSNSHNDNSTDTTNTDASQTNGNGDNRDNSYDFDSKVNTTTNDITSSYNHQDTDTKVTSITDTKDSYNTSTKDSGNAYNYSDSSTHVKDSNNSLSESYTKDSGNYSSDSSTHSSSDYDFGTLKDIGEVSGNVGIAGGDLAFNLGDDYSFNLNLDNILNNSLNGDGNHTGFSLVQANNLADQDTAYNVSMNNAHAHNDLSSEGGDAHSDAGIGFDSKLSWDPSTPVAGHDLTGTSTADSSSILANSGYHQELVQGANMVSNTSDIAITGGDHHDVTTSS